MDDACQLHNDDSLTSLSLLTRLQRTQYDQAAWNEFVDRYGGHIYAWCRNHRLSESDAEDVTQNVLMRMARYIAQLQYDPAKSFRGWLRRATENAISDYYRDNAKQSPQNGSCLLPELNEPSRRDLVQSLEDAFDLELFEEAKRRVQTRVKESRWKSWQLSVETPLSAREIAAQLGVSVGTLYANKNQIQKLIQQEIALLDDP